MVGHVPAVIVTLHAKLKLAYVIQQYWLVFALCQSGGHAWSAVGM
jgi:hypothetical protein